MAKPRNYYIAIKDINSGLQVESWVDRDRHHRDSQLSNHPYVSHIGDNALRTWALGVGVYDDLRKWVTNASLQLSRENLDRQITFPETPMGRVGTFCFSQIMPTEELRGQYNTYYSKSFSSDHQVLRLRLMTQPPYTSLPWDMFYYLERKNHLAQDPGLILVHTPLEPCEPLETKHLELRDPRVVPALFSDLLQPTDPVGHRKFLNNLFERLEKHPNRKWSYTFKDEITDPDTALAEQNPWERLRDRLRSQEPISILHILCHGVMLNKENTKGFHLEASNRYATNFTPSIDEFCDWIRTSKKNIQIVILNVCGSAGMCGASDEAILAERLVRAGVPAVIGMRGNVKLDLVEAFNESFYQELAIRGRIDEAFASARRTLAQRFTDSLTWLAPTLFLHPELYEDYGSTEAIQRFFRARNFLSDDKDLDNLLQAKAEKLYVTGEPFFVPTTIINCRGSNIQPNITDIDGQGPVILLVPPGHGATTHALRVQSLINSKKDWLSYRFDHVNHSLNGRFKRLKYCRQIINALRELLSLQDRQDPKVTEIVDIANLTGLANETKASQSPGEHIVQIAVAPYQTIDRNTVKPSHVESAHWFFEIIWQKKFESYV